MNWKYSVLRPLLVYGGSACVGTGIFKLIRFDINWYWFIGVGLLMIILRIVFRKLLAS